MNSTDIQGSGFSDSKKHYAILDALRGVAALMVVAFHLFEAHATSHLDQLINHGYLAVDFFFLLSGFVIAYSYDDRWGEMTIGSFFKRRLIRLQPMIIMGMIVGAVGFYFQDGVIWPLIHQVPLWKMLLVMLIGFTLIPVLPSLDLRGWGEMHPLDGPAWSLFFEYVGNILYALFVRKFSNTVLALLVFIAGCALIHLAVSSPNGDVIGGWSIEPTQFRIGLTRMMYPFFAGILLSRIAKLKKIENAFILCSAMIILVLVIPRIGGSEHVWMNGLYDSLCIIVMFPIIVYVGACGEIKGRTTKVVGKFLGDISYPIYITHYPLIYIYTAWVAEHKVPMQKAFPVALMTLVSCLILATIFLKLYDEPVRRYLSKRFMLKPAK